MLALLLSWLILVVYQLLLPQKAINILGKSQYYPKDIENKDDSGYHVDLKFVNGHFNNEQKKLHKFSEKIELIENGQLSAEFSNIGGNLQKIVLKYYDYTFPLTNMFNILGYDASEFKSQNKAKDKVIYSFQNDTFQIIKKYIFSSVTGLIHIEISLKNISPQTRSIQFDLNNFTIDASLLDKSSKNQPELALLEYSISQNGQIKRKDNAYKFNTKENSVFLSPINWIGYRTRYYCLIVNPQFPINLSRVEYVDNQKLRITSEIRMIQLTPGESKNLNFVLYVGTQDMETLAMYKNGFEDIVSYSRFGILDFVSKYSVKVLNFIHRFIPSWGISIILLGVFVYTAMYPLTMAGMSSMQKMQALQPKVVQLREQYKNNTQKLNREMMELYQKHKVNPFGGCLPFILQMPIFIGLYQALWRSVSFKGAGFLWVRDLSEPDRLFIFPFHLPFIGNEFNILPILMIGIMILQQKLSSRNMIMTDPKQILQQKIMTTIFPFFIGFIFYKFSSGLTLYFTVFYILSTLTQWKMSKMIVPQSVP